MTFICLLFSELLLSGHFDMEYGDDDDDEYDHTAIVTCFKFGSSGLLHDLLDRVAFCQDLAWMSKGCETVLGVVMCNERGFPVRSLLRRSEGLTLACVPAHRLREEMLFPVTSGVKESLLPSSFARSPWRRQPACSDVFLSPHDLHVHLCFAAFG